MINTIFNPYARGIVRIAPIREDIDTTNLTPTNIQDSDFLEPIKDIIDICGTNPSEITYSKNTSSSEESGRVQKNLNMHKDILGRVRDVTLSFPPMFMEKYSELDELFMNKTQEIEVSTEEVSEETEVTTRKYILWYYVELMLPEADGIIKDIYYVGDSSFTSVKIQYKNTVTEVDENGNPTSIEPLPYAKDLKINLIGKCSINGIGNI